jgi:hypothetical protein
MQTATLKFFLIILIFFVAHVTFNPEILKLTIKTQRRSCRPKALQGDNICRCRKVVSHGSEIISVVLLLMSEMKSTALHYYYCSFIYLFIISDICYMQFQ